MATKRFKKNFTSLLNIIGNNPNDICNFLCERKAFSEEFLMMLSESKDLSSVDYSDLIVRLEEIRQKLKDYDISYNKKNKKYIVDITKNNIFFYNDTEEELVKKMEYYLSIEDYERANILDKYLNKLEIQY